jgi:hypothetical protein
MPVLHSDLHNGDLVSWAKNITENVLQASCTEIEEVLNSAAQLLEPLTPCFEKFLPKVRP